MSRVFPRNSRAIAGQVLLGVCLLAGLVAAAGWYYATPKYTKVGYAPAQPVTYSHRLHVGQLGLDCLYCHTNVAESPHANLPAASTCWNCHGTDKANIKPDSGPVAPLREAHQAGRPVRWVRVHQAPDFVYFNHQIHVNRGVGCVTCHGRVDEMDVVRQAEPMGMAWCLDCHRQTAGMLRPADQVTNLAWAGEAVGQVAMAAADVRPPVTCSGCHR